MLPTLSNPSFGSDDRFGVVMSALHQMENADKSRTVKTQTFRGMQQVALNGGHYGQLPMTWKTRGQRYNRQAYCADLGKAGDIYKRVADGESLQSISNVHGCWPNMVKRLIRFEASHTGVINCNWAGLEWVHKVETVVDSDLWWRANKVLDANATEHQVNKGGRPVACPANWISGLLECPECGGKLYVNSGRTPSGNPRTPVLRCGGMAKTRRSCGRYKAVDARLVAGELDAMFGDDTTGVLAFQRVAGNGHVLDGMKADLAKVQAGCGLAVDDDEFERLSAERRELKSLIAGFELEPDSYDYAPTGKTISGMWHESDDNKRRIVKAVASSIGLDISPVWGMDADNLSLGVLASERVTDGIVDLGEGLCFRQPEAV